MFKRELSIFSYRKHGHHKQHMLKLLSIVSGLFDQGRHPFSIRHNHRWIVWNSSPWLKGNRLRIFNLLYKFLNIFLGEKKQYRIYACSIQWVHNYIRKEKKPSNGGSASTKLQWCLVNQLDVTDGNWGLNVPKSTTFSSRDDWFYHSTITKIHFFT